MKDLKVCGMFLVRVALGAIFVAHGWQKISMMDGTIGFFGSLGLPVAVAYLVAYVEFLGGLAVLLGVYSRIAGYLLAIVMVFAIFLVKIHGNFIGTKGYELDLILLASSLAVAWNGSGPYSLSGKMCGCGACGMCGMKLM